MRRKIISLLLVITLLFSGVARAEEAVRYRLTVPAWADLSFSLETGSSFWRFTLSLGDTELLYFGGEQLGTDPYAVCSLLPCELRLNKASLMRLSESYGLLGLLDKLFHFTEEAEVTADEAASPLTSIIEAYIEEEPAAADTSALSDINLNDVQTMNTMIFLAGILRDSMEESRDEAGLLTRKYTITAQNIRDFFTALITDVSDSPALEAVLDELIAATRFGLLGMDTANLLTLLDSLSGLIADSMADDLVITTVGDGNEKDSAIRAEGSFLLAGSTRHLSLSYENLNLNSEDSKQLAARFQTDFAGFETLNAALLTIAPEDESTTTGIGVAWLNNAAGDTRILSEITEAKGGEAVRLYGGQYGVRNYTEGGKTYEETVCSIIDKNNAMATFTATQDTETGVYDLKLDTAGKTVEVLYSCEATDREVYRFENPVDVSVMTEEEYEEWQSSTVKSILIFLGLTAVRVPSKLFDLPGKISNWLGL